MGGVQKLAETRAGTFVLQSGSLILTDFGPKSGPVVYFLLFFKDILGRRSMKKGVPKRKTSEFF